VLGTRKAQQPGDLAVKPHLGQAPRLSAAQLAQLKQVLLQGPKAHGWPDDLWTYGPFCAAAPVPAFPAAAHQLQSHRRLLQATRGGPLTVLWDRLDIHRKARVVQAYLAKHPEIVAEDFPSYGPELNPDEKVWSSTKNGPQSNRPADDAHGLFDRLIDSLTAFQ
jgi:hypothetical protein